MQKTFNYLIDIGSNDTTYKFALTKFLLDYAHENKPTVRQKILYKDIASKFLEYYWYQECKYKLKQDFKVTRIPEIITIIRKYCGTYYIPQSYSKYFKSRNDIKKSMIVEIENKCFRDVIPRLQPRGSFKFYKHFHELSPSGKKFRLPPKEQRYIELSYDAHKFLEERYHELSKMLIYEWAKFLEKTNFTPRLISKIEDLGHNKRRSLDKFKKDFLAQTGPVCFYCNERVEDIDIHIDHFIPWSYVYEDAHWNLVISCSDCNLKKSNLLAPRECIEKIENRNEISNYNEYNKDIKEYYENCCKAGFLMVEDIKCSWWKRIAQ